MVYSPLVMQHFQHPCGVGVLDIQQDNVVWAQAGTHEQGALVHVYLQWSAQNTIEQARFKAYGCPCTIAAVSCLVSQLTGLDVAQAKALSAGNWAAALQLPPIKLHCAMLAKEAVTTALQHWQNKQQD
ncbi:iron-sulfur cluster assembly scaffold protein [Alcaligenes endophyticus]|uniref:Iron-sulfur cluster assembly scaffold protein n=1 Tax=Alcaligenes endophyticus TaxID=1929088 RepID=A0ABT8EIN5_9BURK|nr:iron-sulfur cluster assembly scaffold protein [Alcaligenes endophyticus]MCX5592428.1 iron-sulfur cluster assembly scaffold protein [Alcaligenes endophyticus]MDN4121153.1 iron-sulfur cluster assembly scaffold protein [Alcaligenes endophyticus]